MGEAKGMVEVQNNASELAAAQPAAVGAPAMPAWCQYVPAGLRGTACRGSSASGCTCAAFCSSTPSSSWSNNPECCGCGAAKSLLEVENNASELAVAQPAAVGAPAMPAWCQYVPAGLRGTACPGSS